MILITVNLRKKKKKKTAQDLQEGFTLCFLKNFIIIYKNVLKAKRRRGCTNGSGNSYIRVFWGLQEVLLLLVMLANAKIFSRPEVYCVWLIKMKHPCQGQFPSKGRRQSKKLMLILFPGQGLDLSARWTQDCQQGPSASSFRSQVLRARIVSPTKGGSVLLAWSRVVAAAAKSRQSCPTLCDPIDGSPPGSPVPGILQARTLEWAAISFSSA